MSIETEINRISTNVSDTLSAVSEMGGEVPEGATSDDMASGVRSIPVGAKIDDTKPSSTTTYSSSKIESEISKLNEANAAQDNRLTALEQAGGIATVEPAEDDVPLLFYSEALPQTKTDTAMPISYTSKTLKRDDADAETKAQGTSSLSYPKKNQTTKFSQAFNFKNWGLQKKYCMKANWIDLTHARNIVSAQLWGDVVKSRANYLDLPELLRTSPNQGAVDGFPALVYADGVYQGRYTVNIPKDAWMANMDKTLDNHCILCGENYVSGCFRAAANINGSDWSDEVHDTVPAAIKTRWNEIISFVMNSTDDEFVSGIGNYFYLDSLIDYYIFGVVSCGLDAFGKNQLYQTYDGQKWIATMYDMDSTWGLWWNGGSFVATNYSRNEFQDFKDGQGNLLYIRLEELFYEPIQARWAELKDTVLSYSNIMTRFERFIGIVPPHIVKEDYASTTGGGKFTGIPSQTANHIQQLRAYVAARLPYADEWFASLTPAVQIPCTGITLDQSTLTFTASGSQTLTATVTPSDTTDAVTWTSDDTSIATVSGGVVTAKANGSATITATCGAYSATCAVSVSGITAGVLPSGYTAVECIKSDNGESWIDTGYIPAANTGAEYKVYVGKSISFGFTGIRATATVFLQITDANSFIVGRRGNEKLINGMPFESMYEASMFVHDDTFVINGVHYDALQVGTSDDTKNIRIGGAQNGNIKAAYKIYYVRFYEGGNLVKNYVPCKNADGVAGLYETVNGDFLTSVTSTPYEAE